MVILREVTSVFSATIFLADTRAKKPTPILSNAATASKKTSVKITPFARYSYGSASRPHPPRPWRQLRHGSRVRLRESRGSSRTPPYPAAARESETAVAVPDYDHPRRLH